MSEAEAMLKSLKRKDSNDSSLDPAAKKPRNSEIECIVISGTDSESPVPDLCQVASTEKQNGEVLSKNGRSIISINLESDSENDVPNVGLTTTVVPECDVEMVTLADSNQITKENKDKIEAPDERKLSKCTVEEEPAEQPSFSLNDEVQHFSVRIFCSLINSATILLDTATVFAGHTFIKPVLLVSEITICLYDDFFYFMCYFQSELGTYPVL